MNDRRTVDTINDDQLGQLYDDLDRAETENAELRDALAHCHEREPRLRAEAAITRVEEAIASFHGRGVITLDHADFDPPTAGEVLNKVRAALIHNDWPAAGNPPICELPHQTVADEDECEQERLARAVAGLAQALRLTREYVGADLLPAVEGWSWYDALRRWAPNELPDAAPSCSPGTEETEPNNSTPPALREQLHAAIESEMYEYRERTMFWEECGGVTEEIARLAARGAMEVLAEQPAPAWTPPPPGSTAEQLPDHLLALIRDRLPDYTSTACQTADTLACTACYPGSGIPRPQYDEIREHAERLHSRCQISNEFTGQLCACGCHPEQPQEAP